MATAKYFNGTSQLSAPYPMLKAQAVALFGETASFKKSDGFSVWVARNASGELMNVERIIFHNAHGKNHKCSSRCRHAKGGECECECGGKFHGAG